jgi:tetratricopeptide (TPR) repeat protein
MTGPGIRETVIQLYSDGSFMEAANLAWQALQERPDDGHLWQLYGTAQCNLQNFKIARDALETANTLVPLHPLAQYALAICYHRLDQPDLACVIYEHLAKHVAGIEMLCRLAARLGDLDKNSAALHVCRKITKLDPARHQAFFGIAYYLCRLGYPPQALIPHLAMALDLAPNTLRYQLNLAFAWAEIGCDQEAHALLNAVNVEDVCCPCVLRRMREVFERVHDHAQSLVCQVRLACVLQ